MEKQGLYNGESNVIPFPNLNSRLLERGLQSLKDKNYKKAMLLFEQLTRLEPENAQASYGLAVCYVELEHYLKAKELTAAMMRQGIGEYYDVLKLHITILIQRHEYEKVVTTIRAVLQEDIPPENVRETLVHLAEFAEVRMKEGEPEEDPSLRHRFSPNIKHDLESKQVDRQWRGIQQGKAIMTEEVIEDYVDYLKNENGDPFLKSMVLKIMSEHGYNETLTVNKHGKIYNVNLKESQLFYEGLSNSVDNLLEKALGSNNPSLLEAALQIWGHFTISVFPKPLEPHQPKVWAAACYVLVHQIHGLNYKYSDLLEYFDVTKEKLVKPLFELKVIEENRPLLE